MLCIDVVAATEARRDVEALVISKCGGKNTEFQAEGKRRQVPDQSTLPFQDELARGQFAGIDLFVVFKEPQ